MNTDNKYNCSFCKFKTNFASEWLIHVKSEKHERLGKPKMNECQLCNYVGLNHWNLKLHILGVHSNREQREQSKYYCDICDKVFFCIAYKNKHMSGKIHKNKEIALKYQNEINELTLKIQNEKL